MAIKKITPRQFQLMKVLGAEMRTRSNHDVEMAVAALMAAGYASQGSEGPQNAKRWCASLMQTVSAQQNGELGEAVDLTATMS